MAKLLATFGGKQVSIVTKQKFSYSGVLCDEDEDYIYLGPDLDCISALISKRDIAMLFDTAIQDVMDAIEEEAPDRKDMN